MTEQILLFPYQAMVTLCCFFNESNVLIKFFLGWEGDTINALEGVIGCLTEPVS
jgi:hypothetical protein